MEAELGGVVTVLTSKSVGKIKRDGGTYPWIAGQKRVQACDYVVCVRTRLSPLKPEGPEPHRQAFLVGRISDVVDAVGSPGRQRIYFSAYSVLSGPEVLWPGANPLHYYPDLEALGIDPQSLEWTDVTPKRTPKRA